MGRVRSVARLAVVAALAVAVVGACEPIDHDQLTVRATPEDPVDLVLLAASGSHAVVRADAAGAGVPGPGNWRVDRATGEAVALPAGTPLRISRDGRRVLVLDGMARTLWSDGTATSLTGTLSRDLRARAFTAADGTVQVEVLGSGVVTPAETGFPRPAGSTAWIRDVSDDGRTVQYGFDRTVRTVDLDAGTAVDRPDGSRETNGEYGGMPYQEVVTDAFHLAPGGATFAHLHQEALYWGEGEQLFASRVELVDAVTGEVLAAYDNPIDPPGGPEPIRFVSINDRGDAVWAYQEHHVPDGFGGCSSAPFAAVCVVSSKAVVVHPGGPPVAIGTGSGRMLDARPSRNGRFLALTKESGYYVGTGSAGPVTVLDWLSDSARAESLTGAPTPSARGHVSDDGLLVATSGHAGGWYEFSATP